jgi:hypothetical protein
MKIRFGSQRRVGVEIDWNDSFDNRNVNITWIFVRHGARGQSPLCFNPNIIADICQAVD